MTGQIIKLVRRKAGITQVQLSERMGNVNIQSNISQWERGKKNILLNTFLDVCKAANVKPNELFKELEL